MHERDILYFPLGVGIFHFQILQIHFLAFFSGKQKIQKVQHSYLRCGKSLKGDSKFLLLLYGRHFSFSSYERNKSKKVPLGHFSWYCWTACYTLCFVTDLLIMLWYPQEINTFRSQGFRHEFRAMLGLQRSEGESRSGLPMVNSRSYNNYVSFLYEIM